MAVDWTAVALEQWQMHQIQQNRGPSLAFSLHSGKDAGIGEYSLALLYYKKVPVTLVNAGQFQQSELDNKYRSEQTCFKG